MRKLLPTRLIVMDVPKVERWTARLFCPKARPTCPASRVGQDKKSSRIITQVTHLRRQGIANMSNTKTSHEEAYINLSKEEEADLLSSIEEAKQRLSQFHRPITWKEALSLLRETVGPAWWRMMKNHKSERMLN